MCLVKKPKVVAAATDKEPAIITNPYLDGLPAIERARTASSQTAGGDAATPRCRVAPCVSRVGARQRLAARRRIA